MEDARKRPDFDAPSLNVLLALQQPAKRAVGRKPKLEIRRIVLADGRIEYRIPSQDPAVRIYYWCRKSGRREMEQSLIDRYKEYRVKFYVLN